MWSVRNERLSLGSRNVEVLNLFNQNSHRNNRDSDHDNEIGDSILIHLTFKYNYTFYNFKMRAYSVFWWSLEQKIVKISASKITETKTIQELQRRFPEIRGLKLSDQMRWILEICSKRTLHRLLEHDQDHKTFAV